MYNFKEIEKKWQEYWKEKDLYKFDKNGDKKIYLLEMFSYPSGAKLHMGHAYNYSVPDAWGRYKRMTGYNVFNPMGFDAFGLPAENYAIKTGVHPKDSTEKNIETMINQIEAIGGIFNWDNDVITCRPEYYKWTQWMFLKLYERGLAYKKEAPVNFCPSCNTVLANEQVIAGECERCGSTVLRKNLSQWFFKITDYAEELLSGLDTVDWPEKTKSLQKNWIGKSHGAYVDFKVDGTDKTFTVFTTRPDTLFGATYCVLAPEHKLVSQITTEEQRKDVEVYQLEASKQSDIERTITTKEKTGVPTGAYAINPVNGAKIPIWISDYVLSTYGTGAIMAVPAHDERDFEFARKFNIPIIQVLEEVTGTLHKNETHKDSIVAVVYDEKADKYLTINWHENGGRLFVDGTRKDGESAAECAIREIVEKTGYDDIELVRETFKINHHCYAYNKDRYFEIESTGLLFKLKSNHKIKQNLDEDEKFDVEWVSKNVIEAEIEDELHTKTFEYCLEDKAMVGDGVHINSEFINGLTKEDAIKKMNEYLEQKKFGKETVSYKLRDWLVSRQRYWGAPIPIIYCDRCGVVPVPEKDLPVELPYNVEFTPDGESPLAKSEEFVNCTCPKCGERAKRECDTLDTFVCSSWYYLRYPDPFNDEKPFNKETVDKMLPVDVYIGGVEHACMHLLYARFFTKALRDMGYLSFDEPFKKLIHQGIILDPKGQKMSKSKGNTVSPDEYIEAYGSDVLRAYLMFAFNYEDGGPWSEEGIKAIDKFLGRVYRLIEEYDGNELETRYDDIDYVLNNTIKSVREDIEKFQMNTSIARIMEYVNILTKKKGKGLVIPKYYLEQLTILLAPFTPHITEEMWCMLGHEPSVHNEPYPECDSSKLVVRTYEMVVQINGKVRAKIEMRTDASKEDMEKVALENENVKKFTLGKEIVKVISIPNKLVNIVVK